MIGNIGSMTMVSNGDDACQLLLPGALGIWCDAAERLALYRDTCACLTEANKVLISHAPHVPRPRKLTYCLLSSAFRPPAPMLLSALLHWRTNGSFRDACLKIEENWLYPACSTAERTLFCTAFDLLR